MVEVREIMVRILIERDGGEESKRHNPFNNFFRRNKLVSDHVFFANLFSDPSCALFIINSHPAGTIYYGVDNNTIDKIVCGSPHYSNLPFLLLCLLPRIFKYLTTNDLGNVSIAKSPNIN